jgi:chitinase
LGKTFFAKFCEINIGIRHVIEILLLLPPKKHIKMNHFKIIQKVCGVVICTIFAMLMSSNNLVAQLPSNTLVGYWHNWNNADAPYMPLTSVDERYNVVIVAFANPQYGTNATMEFVPESGTAQQFANQIATLQSEGRKVLISVGGANGAITLSDEAAKQSFITSMTNLLSQYGFDGIDIDIEGASSCILAQGGTISNPSNPAQVRLIEGIKTIMSNYWSIYNRKMLLTAAPETAFVQGGMSAYGNAWGGYLPVLDGLRDSLDILQVQLYNSGSMYGINGGEYFVGTADFIVSQTEAVIQGFSTTAGTFAGLPASKICVGLPACNLAAGSGYMDTATVAAAIRYLMGTGPQPGSYTLVQSGGYPNLKGMMTWSINWDAAANCNGTFSFADNYCRLFSSCSGAYNADTIINASVCYGENYNSNGFNITNATASNSYNITYPNDSIVVLNLYVYPPAQNIELSASLCYGQSYTNYEFSENMTGNYYDTLQNQFGCDSIIYHLDLIVGEAVHDTIYIHNTTYIHDTIFIYDTVYITLYDTIHIDTCTQGIDEIIGETSLSLHPNPVNNFVVINIGTNASGDVVVYDMKGVAVLRKKIDSHSVTMDMRHLSTGVYTLTIMDNGIVKARGKIIKQ